MATVHSIQKTVLSYMLSLGFADLTRGWSCSNHTTNNCEHYCHQYQHGVRCSCEDGYELNDDGHSCDGG